MTNSTAAEITLQLKDFGLEVGDRTLVSGVDLLLEPRGMSVIFGRSGSGKTTLLRAWALLTPHQGSIRIGDRNIGSCKPEEYRRRVQFLHQEPFLFPGTVGENLQVPFSLKQNRKHEPDPQVTEQHLQGVGLSLDILEQDSEKLSGGEKQRVALVRSLLQSPEFLLLDEPTSAMDVASEELTLEYLRGLSAQMGVVMVSHSVEVIGSADRVLLLAEGKLSEVTGPLDRQAIKRLVEDG